MDDWLVVKNSADKTEIGIFDKLPARKFVWQTVTFTFEDNNKYSSGILYHITLISNLQKCINVVRNKTLQLNLPQLLHKYTNEIILTKDSTIVNVNDDMTLTKEFSLAYSDEFFYNISHGDKSVLLTYNIRVLTDNYIAYARLPPLYLGEYYSFDFSDLLAIGVKITNIFCLPNGLNREENKIVGTVTEISGELVCPHKIVVEVEEIDCGCDDEEDDCNDCNLITGNKDSCCSFDSRMFFINIIRQPSKIDISFKKDIGELNDNILTINMTGSEIDLSDYINNLDQVDIRYSAGLNLDSNLFKHTNKRGPQTVIVVEYKDQGMWIELGKIIVNVLLESTRTRKERIIAILTRGTDTIIQYAQLFAFSNDREGVDSVSWDLVAAVNEINSKKLK